MKEILGKYKQLIVGFFASLLLTGTTAIYSGFVNIYTYPSKNSKLDSIQQLSIEENKNALKSMITRAEHRVIDSVYSKKLDNLVINLDEYKNSNAKDRDEIVKILYKVLGNVESIKVNMKYPPYIFGDVGLASKDTVLPASVCKK